jgi:hypothetical protein
MGTNHDPIFAVDVQQYTFIFLCQLFNFAMGLIMKIVMTVFQVFFDRPIADDKSLAFLEFLFITTIRACKSIACAHNSIVLFVIYLFDDCKSPIKLSLFALQTVIYPPMKMETLPDGKNIATFY